jgi:hypothetical protein
LEDDRQGDSNSQENDRQSVGKHLGGPSPAPRNEKTAPIKSTIPAYFHECLVIAQGCVTAKAKDQVK